MSKDVFAQIVQQEREKRQNEAARKQAWHKSAGDLVKTLHATFLQFSDCLLDLALWNGTPLRNVQDDGTLRADGIRVRYRNADKWQWLDLKVVAETEKSRQSVTLEQGGQGMGGDHEVLVRFPEQATPTYMCRSLLEALMPYLQLPEPQPEEKPQDKDDEAQTGQWRPMSIAFSRLDRLEITNLAVLHIDTLHNDADQAIRAIRRAVTAWVQSSQAGKVVYAGADDDLNIGDLLGHDALEDKDLLALLHAHGVVVHDVDDPIIVPYDRVLVDSIMDADDGQIER
ncbi:hypothetical protein [Noviherbaspirillum galbum]|uniref:Uncharacterized protein n=1 Tax=Noviherbaspirillum galbum TaxID=2709383 RepID=A0A6B3SR12_9BURK|nr:hypothetical protein [Noviherbaspirillum galbum]NEX60099.1 hypothetical protein [Noviherbaspirillum galbum]